MAAIPQHVHLVQSFANSVDLSSEQDDLDSTQRFGRWLGDHGFPGITPSEAELSLSREVRAALREEMAAHHDGVTSPEARSTIDGYAARIPLRVSFGGGPATFVPAGSGVEAMLGAVLAEAAMAERDGTWRRLKLCGESTCAVVYYDHSKNQSKAWCTMAVCGNRNKTKTYRQRTSK